MENVAVAATLKLGIVVLLHFAFTVERSRSLCSGVKRISQARSGAQPGNFL